jgi:tetratricopeptide (TPR) repeat protein
MRRRVPLSIVAALSLSTVGAGLAPPARCRTTTTPLHFSNVYSPRVPINPPPSPPEDSVRPQAPSHTKVRVPDVDPELQGLLTQAQEAMDKKDYPVAIKFYSDYLAKKPDDAGIHFQLGYSYTAAHDSENAAKEYRRATELDPKMLPAFVNLGLALLETQPAEAVAPFRKAVELAPDASRPKVLLGVALEKSGDAQGAIEQLRAARNLDSGNLDIELELGRALLFAKRYEEAEKEFRAALTLRPDSGIAHYGLSECLIAQKKNELAAAELSTYLQSSPKDEVARIKRASILTDLGKNEEALAELDQAATVRPESPETLKLRSLVDYRLKKYDASITALQKLETASPGDVDIHARLGHVLLEKKDYPGAVKELVIAFRADPKQEDVLHDLLLAEYLGGNYTAALALLDEVGKRETLAIGSIYIRASCYDKLGQKQQALETYRKFLELNDGKTNDEYFVSAERARILEREIKEKKK